MLQGVSVFALEFYSPDYKGNHWKLCNIVSSCCESLLSFSITQQEVASIAQLFVTSCGCLSILVRRSLYACHQVELWEPAKAQSLRITEFCSKAIEQMVPLLKESFSTYPNILPYYLGVCNLSSRFRSHSQGCLQFV